MHEEQPFVVTTETVAHSILLVPPDAISSAAICEPPRLGIRLGVCEKAKLNVAKCVNLLLEDTQQPPLTELTEPLSARSSHARLLEGKGFHFHTNGVQRRNKHFCCCAEALRF